MGRLQRNRGYGVGEGAPYVWRSYSIADDIERTNRHYDQPAEFFTLITGGEWNIYSCNIWEGVASETESQERKMDLLAGLMQLKPRQRVLDIGCGWAGPLVYLSSRYGIRGEGLTLSGTQKEHADSRIARYGVDVTVHVCHWRDFEKREEYDAVYTDEVIVHFNDLLGFFQKVRALLKPGGVMLNKELHFTHSKYMKLTRAMILLNKIFGETGNYRMLHQELAFLDEAGFRLERIDQLPIREYARTSAAWLSNMARHQDRLVQLVGHEHYDFFRTYLRIVRKIHSSNLPPMTCDIVVARTAGP